MIYYVFDAKICQISATIINVFEFDMQNYTLSIFKIHFLEKLSNFFKLMLRKCFLLDKNQISTRPEKKHKK